MDFSSIYNYIMGVFSALINIPLSLIHVLVYTVIELAKKVCMMDEYSTEETEEAEAEANNTDNNKHIGFRQ